MRLAPKKFGHTVCVRVALEIEYPSLAPAEAAARTTEHGILPCRERSTLAIGQFAILFPPRFDKTRQHFRNAKEGRILNRAFFFCLGWGWGGGCLSARVAVRGKLPPPPPLWGNRNRSSLMVNPPPLRILFGVQFLHFSQSTNFGTVNSLRGGGIRCPLLEISPRGDMSCCQIRINLSTKYLWTVDPPRHSGVVGTTTVLTPLCNARTVVTYVHGGGEGYRSPPPRRASPNPPPPGHFIDPPLSQENFFIDPPFFGEKNFYCACKNQQNVPQKCKITTVF